MVVCQNMWKSEDHDFSHILETIRESGDGDSGTEEKKCENMLVEDTNKDYESVKQALLDITRQGVDNSRVKKQSKIPIRQNRVPYTPSAASPFYGNERCYLQIVENVEVIDETFSEVQGTLLEDNSIDLGSFKSSDTEVVSNEKSDPSVSAVLHWKKQGSGIDKSKLDHLSHIFKDLAFIDASYESESNMDSLSPEVPLACEDLYETILEAPEEFQTEDIIDLCECDDNSINTTPDGTSASSINLCAPNRDLRESEQLTIAPLCRDHDNSDTAETGDTCGRALDKDKNESGNRGSEITSDTAATVSDIYMRNEVKQGSIEQANVENICASPNEPARSMVREVIGAEEDKVHTEDNRNNVVTNEWHVGTCKPATPVNLDGVASDYNARSQSSFKQDATDMQDNNSAASYLSSPMNEGKAAEITAVTDEAVESAHIKVNSVCESSVSATDTITWNNWASSSVPTPDVGVCAENQQTSPTVTPSIENGVARCAQAPGCSRDLTATVCAALISEERFRTSSCEDSLQKTPLQCNLNFPVNNSYSANSEVLSQCSESVDDKITCEQQVKGDSIVSDKNANENLKLKSDSNPNSLLSWDFRNGRLVFDVATCDTNESERGSDKSLKHSSRIDNRTEQVAVGTLTFQIKDLPEKEQRAEDNKKGQSINKLGEIISVSANNKEEEVNEILHSRDFNKRLDDSRSRLKYLEQKLKNAGIIDEATFSSDLKDKNFPRYQYNKRLFDLQQENVEVDEEQTQVVDKLISEGEHKKLVLYDRNENEIECGANKNQVVEEEYVIQEVDKDQLEFKGSCCEFDVRQVGSFAGFEADDYYVVYDELEDDSSEEDHEHYALINRCAMRGDGIMGTDGERAKQHNPDHDNLKSLLKKPGRGKDGRKNKVIFNENKNEFFDADYIILIREECDYGDEDDDGVCCCNQHEMVRLACCEPNCNCNSYDGYADQTPQSPKFAPPLEFVDAVTLSPPEGYKDMELGEQQLIALQQMSRRGQRTAVCRECSATHEDEGEGSQSDNEEGTQAIDQVVTREKEKTDQSQQTTPTTPPAESENSDGQKYILETITMTTVKEKRVLRDSTEEEKKVTLPSSFSSNGSPISGILKGGRLWKQQSSDANGGKCLETLQTSDQNSASDEEGSSKRSVRFIESNDDKRDVCDGAADDSVEEICRPTEDTERKETANCNNSVSPESTEMMLTFKLGNHVLISNNSLKPNSAVRQLFPCTKPLPNKPGEDESVHQYLVTAESLRAFEEAKRSKLPQIIQSGDTDESIKRAIERNTLRRSLIRYEPRSKKNAQKTDNSLVERIKQLTCDVDDISQDADMSARTSPPGEEARNSPEINHAINKNHDKSFSPSSSSTASSSSSSVSSTYKKITDLFAKKEKVPDIQNNVITNEPINRQLVHTGPAPDLGNGGGLHHQELMDSHHSLNKTNPTNEARKQFLSTLAPLTACVSGVGTNEEYYCQMGNNPGERMSTASSIGNEYSLEDIDEGLKNDDEESKRIAPDVLAGTPSASESGDELAMFVQQDAGRIERIKKKYQQETTNEEDDEHDDYGFNRRPSVRGIKPKFGTTTEILQQIQNQLQPPVVSAARPNNHVAWPYYSESGLSGFDNTKRNINQSIYQHSNIAEDMKSRNFVPHFRPVGIVDENIYQNCTNQRCSREILYRTNVNQVYAPVVRVGGGCTDYYQSLPRNRNGRPLSPPPLDVSKNFHQTMVYIPYNHIEGYQPTSMSPNSYYTASNDACYARVSNQNQINKRYIDPVCATQHIEEQRYQTNMGQIHPKQMVRVTYTNQQTHLMNSRSESPLPGQFSTARSTQTPSATISACSYYPTNARYRSMAVPTWQGESMYATKLNRHSFPAAGPRYVNPDHASLTDTDSQHNMPNGLRHNLDINFSTPKDSMPNSPTKPRYIERGAPEGAASISPQDTSVQNTSTMTSPSSPQQKPLFYAMNV